MLVLRSKLISQFFGGDEERVIPVPIPNTEVKSLVAEDTWMVTSWENRELPNLYKSLKVNALRLF